VKMRRSVILESGVAVASGPILVFSIYLLAAGHNQPGGGFAGGLVAAVVVLLAWAAGGPDSVRRVVPVSASVLAGSGLVIAAVTGLVPMVLGGSLLESGYVEVAIPWIGDIKLVSALGFDIGVYLVVLGMVVGLLTSLGQESRR